MPKKRPTINRTSNPPSIGAPTGPGGGGGGPSASRGQNAGA